MKSKLLFILVVSLCFVTDGLAKTIAVKAGLLIADARKAPVPNAVVVIEDGIIKSAGPGIAIPAGAEVLDLSAFTVLPGLLDAHSHLYTGDRADMMRAAPVEKVLFAQLGMRNALESGVTAIRVVGCDDFMDVALRNAINRGIIPGPRVLAAANALTIPAGHGDSFVLSPTLLFKDVYDPLHGFVNSPDQVEEAIHLQIKYGADFIKLLASGGAGSPLDSPTQQNLSLDEIRRAVIIARGAGKKVASHAENLVSIQQSVEAGVDSIEHGSELDEATIARMKEKRIYYDPCPVHRLEAAGKEYANNQEISWRKRRALFEKHVASFRLALKVGGLMYSGGSDVSYGPGSPTLVTELVTQVRYGLSPQQVLISATTANADLFGMTGEIGTLEPGKMADLIAVKGNPLESIQALQNMVLVMRAGIVYVNRTGP